MKLSRARAREGVTRTTTIGQYAAGQAAQDIVRVDKPRARCPVWDSQIWRTFLASSPELTEDLRLYLMNIKSLDYRNETLRTWADIK